jgi:hypothetical protein
MVTALGVVGILIGIMLTPKLGPWGIVLGVTILFLGVFSWLFEPSYSTLPPPGGRL